MSIICVWVTLKIATIVASLFMKEILWSSLKREDTDFDLGSHYIARKCLQMGWTLWFWIATGFLGWHIINSAIAPPNAHRNRLGNPCSPSDYGSSSYLLCLGVTKIWTKKPYFILFMYLKFFFIVN